MTSAKITQDNITELVLNPEEGKVLLDFWADWCAPCKAFSPIFEKHSELKPDIKHAKLNVDEETELAQLFNITSIPTLALFDKGKLVKTVSGAMSVNDLKNWVEN